MSGNILIVDGVATNRIVLKVKLSSAYYEVTQASSCEEALAVMRARRPDVILTSSELPDGTLDDFLERIKVVSGREMAPVIVLTEEALPQDRANILRAGAADVIAKPFNETVLLARLRSLTREDRSETQYGLETKTAHALGFSEAPVPFTARGQIAVMSCETPKLQAINRTLLRHSMHHVELFDVDQSKGVAGLTTAPDVFLLVLEETPNHPGLALLAELRSAPTTRNARFVVLIDDLNSTLAATLLDLGAHDVIDTKMKLDEINIRLGVQLRHKQANDALRARVASGLEAAVTDPLTGLHNRRYATTQLERMVAETNKTQDGFAIMVADLDHFKTINDRYGHTVGDAVLTRVASQLQMAIRPQDIVARIGGEEFLFLLPGAGRLTARDLAELVCRLVRETPIYVPGEPEPIHVTISVGATVADPCGRTTPLAAESLLAQADQALYGSKAEGRDMVTFTRLSAA